MFVFSSCRFGGFFPLDIRILQVSHSVIRYLESSVMYDRKICAYLKMFIVKGKLWLIWVNFLDFPFFLFLFPNIRLLNLIYAVCSVLIKIPVFFSLSVMMENVKAFVSVVSSK